MTWALAQFGYVGEAFYGAGDNAAITSRLDNGWPVVVWLALWGDQSFRTDYDGQSFTLVPGMHVMVAYGYDTEGIYLSDPGFRHLSVLRLEHLQQPVERPRRDGAGDLPRLLTRSRVFDLRNTLSKCPGIRAPALAEPTRISKSHCNALLDGSAASNWRQRCGEG